MGPYAVRMDLFAVKTYDGTIGGWCYSYITTNRKHAHQFACDFRNDHSLGICRQAKVVHPVQWVVDAYLAYGNRIYGEKQNGYSHSRLYPKCQL